MSKRTKTVLLVLGALIVSIAVLAGIAYVAVRPLVERRVIAEAKARGVILVIGGLGFDWSSVTIDNARFELVGVRGVTGKAQRIRVELDGTTPKQIAIDAPEIIVEADPFTLIGDLQRWREQYPSNSRTPLGARNAALSWKLPGSKWLDLNVLGATAAQAGSSASLVGTRAKLNGKSVGPFGLYVGTARWLVTLGFDEADPRASPVRIELAPDAQAPSAKLTLAKAPLARVLDVFGAPIPDAAISISGSTELTTGPNWSGEAKGAAKFVLDGFIPPHPVELTPFVFGRTTLVSSNLTLSADRSLLRLDETSLRAGTFALAGKGTLLRAGDHGTLEMALEGDLGCGALADAAAKVHLGSILGNWVGSAARQNLTGGVHFWVRVSADTRNLADARVARRMGIGCGLKPLALPDLSALPSLTDLTKKLPELPPMPDLGPGFVIPDGIQLPTLPAQPNEPKPAGP